MFFDHRYPGTDLHEIDLGYILTKVQDLDDKIRILYENGTVKFADPVEWNILTNYTAGTIVKEPVTSAFYIAKDNVPSGIQLFNEEYWQSLGLIETADYSGEIARLDAEIAIVSGTANTAAQTAQTANAAAQGAAQTAQSAANTAAAAQQTADNVSGTAQTALSTAQTAEQTANAAQQTANAIAGTANTALSTANSANTTAQNAASAAAAAQAAAAAAAPKPHDSATDEYGKGTSSRFGHVKVSDNLSTSAGSANDGVAASSQAANTLYNSLQTLIQTIAAKVSKAGDTMTGILHMSNKGINFDSSLIDKTTTPASVVNSEPIVFKDMNDQTLGQIRFRHKTDGTLEMRLITQGQNGSHELDIQVQSDGTPSIAVTDPVAWQQAIACATASDINALTTLYNATVKAVSTESATIQNVIDKFTSIGDIKVVATSQAFNNTILSDNTQGYILGHRYATNRISTIIKTRNNLYHGYIDSSTKTLYWYKVQTGNQNTYTET